MKRFKLLKLNILITVTAVIVITLYLYNFYSKYNQRGNWRI
ncbi:hypothetical protein [Clostridium sp. Marseille-QA1073]